MHTRISTFHNVREREVKSVPRWKVFIELSQWIKRQTGLLTNIWKIETTQLTNGCGGNVHLKTADTLSFRVGTQHFRKRARAETISQIQTHFKAKTFFTIHDIFCELNYIANQWQGNLRAQTFRTVQPTRVRSHPETFDSGGDQRTVPVSARVGLQGTAWSKMPIRKGCVRYESTDVTP